MNANWIKFIGEEIKFIKSFADFLNLYSKAAYAAPRLFNREYQKTNIPLSLQIEPTNCCNVSCICCSTKESTRPRGFMDLQLFREIVDNAANCKVRRLFLYLHGEPFLHPQIVEMIR